MTAIMLLTGEANETSTLTAIMLGMHRQQRTTALADIDKPIFSQRINPHCLLLFETENTKSKYVENKNKNILKDVCRRWDAVLIYKTVAQKQA